MSDIGADYDAVRKLVDAAQKRLIEKLGKEKAKEHDLVSCLFLKFETDRNYAWQALLRRFSRDPSQQGNVKGDTELTFALSMCLVALEVALGERPPAQSVKTNAAVRTPPSSFNDEIPF